MRRTLHKVSKIPEENFEPDASSRKIFLSGTIDDSQAQRTIENLFSLSEQSEEAILLIVNSLGGMVREMFAINDAINLINAPVNILILGQASSAAATLTILQPSGRRFITPSSNMMIHDVRSGYSGKVSEMKNYVDRSVQLQSKIEKGILENSRLTRRQMRRLMKEEKVISAAEAVEWGLVDAIITRLDEI